VVRQLGSGEGRQGNHHGHREHREEDAPPVRVQVEDDLFALLEQSSRVRHG
jgi:hypothetical protein